MIALLIFLLFAIIIGSILAVSKQAFKVSGNPLVDNINAILPQTQCGQCQYPGCKPYAKAIARGEAEINQCPPGGQEGVDALAALLGVDTMELDTANAISDEQQVAFIIEEDCIGCTLCIKACPVDAIVGASKLMTTIIASECTGCELCLPPCPVDCIVMQPLPQTLQTYIPVITS